MASPWAWSTAADWPARNSIAPAILNLNLGIGVLDRFSVSAGGLRRPRER
jgi:hypothetical protein